jgi:hypothetical protein
MEVDALEGGLAPLLIGGRLLAATVSYLNSNNTVGKPIQRMIMRGRSFSNSHAVSHRSCHHFLHSHIILI